MLLIRPEPTPYGLRVTAPELPTWRSRHLTRQPGAGLVVELAPHRRARGRGDRRLVLQGAGTAGPPRPPRRPPRRPTDPHFSEPDDRVNLADGFPLLLATEESLAALNDELLSASDAGREPLPMTRFRPNLVVTGFPPWAEDDWRRIRVGDAIFRAVKGCARCVITTIDPVTAERGEGADQVAGPHPALGRCDLVRDQPDPRHPGRDPQRRRPRRGPRLGGARRRPDPPGALSRRKGDPGTGGVDVETRLARTVATHPRDAGSSVSRVPAGRSPLLWSPTRGSLDLPQRGTTTEGLKLTDVDQSVSSVLRDQPSSAPADDDELPTDCQFSCKGR